MRDLKSYLYAKFGSSINLEEQAWLIDHPSFKSSLIERKNLIHFINKLKKNQKLSQKLFSLTLQTDYHIYRLLKAWSLVFRRSIVFQTFEWRLCFIFLLVIRTVSTNFTHKSRVFGVWHVVLAICKGVHHLKVHLLAVYFTHNIVYNFCLLVQLGAHTMPLDLRLGSALKHWNPPELSLDLLVHVAVHSVKHVISLDRAWETPRRYFLAHLAGDHAHDARLAHTLSSAVEASRAPFSTSSLACTYRYLMQAALRVLIFLGQLARWSDADIAVASWCGHFGAS